MPSPASRGRLCPPLAAPPSIFQASHRMPLTARPAALLTMQRPRDYTGPTWLTQAAILRSADEHFPSKDHNNIHRLQELGRPTSEGPLFGPPPSIPLYLKTALGGRWNDLFLRTRKQLKEHRPALSSTCLQVFSTTPHHLLNDTGHCSRSE